MQITETKPDEVETKLPKSPFLARYGESGALCLISNVAEKTKFRVTFLEEERSTGLPLCAGCEIVTNGEDILKNYSLVFGIITLRNSYI